MIKLLHVAAIGALVSSAFYAYTIKYDTTLHGEQLTKLKAKAQKEREAIAVLKAEWQYLNRPDRIQALSDKHLSLRPLAVAQVVRVQDIPMKGPKVDSIARKLEDLGLMTASIPAAPDKPIIANGSKPAGPRAVLARPSVKKTAVSKPGQAKGPLAISPLTGAQTAKPGAAKPAPLQSTGARSPLARPAVGKVADSSPRTAQALPQPIRDRTEGRN